jgi:uncharacterized protein (TIGR03118 family)
MNPSLRSLHMRTARPLLRAALLATAITYSTAALCQAVQQINLATDDNGFLVSQGLAPAANVDPNLINPWGMSFSPTSPFWISNQGSGNATLYTGTGTPFPQPTPLVVTIPGSATGPSGPTGQAFNSTTSFVLSNNNPAAFLFANLNGTISGWNGGSGTNAQVVAGTPGAAVYTGLAIGSSGGNNYIYAANHAGGIDVFNQNFALTTLAGNFTDPNLPADLSPFNVANIGGQLYVTYAQVGPDADEAPLGMGIVDIFNLDGSFVNRFVTGSLANNVVSPWGITLAPSGFGGLGGNFLIGNFSDENGFINIFDPSGGYLGQLTMNGAPFNMPYLWALGTRTGGPGADPNAVYFTAGIGDEEHGLFGELRAVPEPSTWTMMLLGFGVVGMALRRGAKPVLAQVA